ncbi:hypothetical protein [Pseudomonas sp. RIT-PI-AD]|uniref:hypothetical protein n=1 Tax=Pseudomonas sp. RIT-PI-AD TaxID=3035294 RepID=UPI0021DAC566|nr:hypothetical protein [Pseudomonas sp. RIT-PI-AD]
MSIENRIVCLGWGSLLWKPDPLPLASAWRAGGPLLPLEFARESDGGELAIVLCEQAPPAPTYWAYLQVDSLEAAREWLRRREQIDPQRPEGIGSLDLSSDDVRHPLIAAWAEREGIPAVIWTALPPRSAGQEGRIPSEAEVVRYLNDLQGEPRAHAEAYVRQVPSEIRTPYREAIERQLGWTPRPA